MLMTNDFIFQLIKFDNKIKFAIELGFRKQEKKFLRSFLLV